jgi:hypothetical protein
VLNAILISLVRTAHWSEIPPWGLYEFKTTSFQARSFIYRGFGYFAGEAPATSDPEDPDGRAKKVNVPSVVRIGIFERGSMICVADTVSKPDGTWRVEYLNPDIFYTVIGFDDAGLVNAAIQDWVQPAAMV